MRRCSTMEVRLVWRVHVIRHETGRCTTDGGRDARRTDGVLLLWNIRMDADAGGVSYGSPVGLECYKEK